MSRLAINMPTVVTDKATHLYSILNFMETHIVICILLTSWQEIGAVYRTL
jgi:hypothetical protein